KSDWQSDLRFSFMVVCTTHVVSSENTPPEGSRDGLCYKLNLREAGFSSLLYNSQRKSLS
ncbi:MAG: hypothetical protein KC413_09230, partial [Anaerolineales bacterium]|nr:hypothetical protein [Anaerolineales bacterium]